MTTGEQREPTTRGAQWVSLLSRHTRDIAGAPPLWCCSRCRWLVANGYQQYLLDLIMINVVLAVGLNIVKGFAGQVNVGHVALAAIGAYTSAVLSTKFGVPFWFALPLATLATGLVGAIVGVPSFRLEGAYLALATLGLAESVRIFIAVTDYLGASIGYGDIPPPIIAGWRLDSYYGVLLRGDADRHDRHLHRLLDPAFRCRPGVQGDPRGYAGCRGRRASMCANTSCSPSSSARFTPGAPAAWRRIWRRASSTPTTTTSPAWSR